MVKQNTRLEDLARIAGVSTATISRALNDSPHVNQNTKRRIWKLAQEHNYALRPSMPAILSGATASIAIVIPMQPDREGRTADPFFLELIAGVSRAAREVNCDIIVSHLAPKNFDDLSSLISTNRSSGIIFLGQSFLHDRFNRLTETDGRFVVWGAELSGQLYGSVGTDNVRGGQRAIEHLLRLGRKRIVFLGDTEEPEINQRFQGYCTALQAAGHQVDMDLVTQSRYMTEAASASIDSLLAREVSFDAVFATSDLLAIGAMRTLQQAGRSVPGDVSVVGYDNIQMARYASPALTTVSQDMVTAGRVMVSKLFSGLDSRDIPSERLPTDLIIRESCGA